jgi:hypothetical protein
LEIIRAAQARIGDEPIETEADAGADTYLAIYDTKVDDIISRYPWAFATVTRRLTRLSVKPVAHWHFFFQLPSEMIGAPRAVEICRGLTAQFGPRFHAPALLREMAETGETFYGRFAGEKAAA